MNAELVEAAVQTTRGVLEGVRPEQLGAPSPCRSWTVADVIAHMIDTHRNFVAIMAGGELAATSVPPARCLPRPPALNRSPAAWRRPPGRFVAWRPKLV